MWIMLDLQPGLLDNIIVESIRGYPGLHITWLRGFVFLARLKAGPSVPLTVRRGRFPNGPDSTRAFFVAWSWNVKPLGGRMFIVLQDVFNGLAIKRARKKIIRINQRWALWYQGRKPLAEINRMRTAWYLEPITASENRIIKVWPPDTPIKDLMRSSIKIHRWVLKARARAFMPALGRELC